MTLFRCVCLAGVVTLAFGSVSQAQFSPDNVLADPFTAYYGYFIPRQQSIAAQRAGGAVESINLNAAARRAAATASRNTGGGMFQLNNPYELDRVTDRNFVRPPTILVPGQPAGPQQGTYFGRFHSSYGLSPVGRPGSYRAAAPQIGGGLRGGRGLRGGIGGAGGRGGGGFR